MMWARDIHFGCYLIFFINVPHAAMKHSNFIPLHHMQCLKFLLLPFQLTFTFLISSVLASRFFSFILIRVICDSIAWFFCGVLQSHRYSSWSSSISSSRCFYNILSFRSHGFQPSSGFCVEPENGWIKIHQQSPEKRSIQNPPQKSSKKSSRIRPVENSKRWVKTMLNVGAVLSVVTNEQMIFAFCGMKIVSHLQTMTLIYSSFHHSGSFS